MHIWLDPGVGGQAQGAMRGPGESYSDLIVLVAARGERRAREKRKSKPPMARGMDGCNDKKSTTPLSLTQKR